MQERTGKSEGGSKVSRGERDVKEGKWNLRKLMKNEMKTKRKDIELAAGLKKMKDLEIQSYWLDIKRQWLERCNNCLPGKIKQKKIWCCRKHLYIHFILWVMKIWTICNMPTYKQSHLYYSLKPRWMDAVIFILLDLYPSIKISNVKFKFLLFWISLTHQYCAWWDYDRHLQQLWYYQQQMWTYTELYSFLI